MKFESKQQLGWGDREIKRWDIWRISAIVSHSQLSWATHPDRQVDNDMKIPLGKKVAIGLMIFIYGMGMLAINLSDNLKVTRGELTRFYSAKMDSCLITRIDTINYTGGRGKYQIFYTDCDAEFYPILFESGDKAIFTINSKIIKESNSVEFRLLSNDKFTDSKMRHPDNEDDRAFGTKVASIFMCIATVLILLTPNSKFEK